MKIKKSAIFISAALMFLAGCAANLRSPVTGVLMTTVKGPVDYESGFNGQDYEILGEAVGTSSVQSILGLFAAGDASIATAYRNALKKFPNADALIDIKVDYQATSVLMLFASHKTIVRGTAIRFRKRELSLRSRNVGTARLHQPVTESSEIAGKKEMKPAQPIIPQQDVSPEVKEFRAKIIGVLSKSRRLRQRFGKWAKKNNLPTDYKEWAATLDKKALLLFEKSQSSHMGWLSLLFSDEISLK